MKVCKKCGFQNEEVAQFCENCGSPLTGNKKNKLIYIIPCIIVIVIAIAISSIFVFSNSDTKKYDDKLEEGQKYVEELDYEKAEDAYLEAIDIDPKQPQAYLELADVYLSEDKVEKSIEILEKGIENVNEENQKDLENKLEKIKKQYSTEALIIKDLTNKMKNKNYEKILSFFKKERKDMSEEVYYYQNGEIVDELSLGEATILMENGIYVGEVKNGKRDGQGQQLGIYTDDFSYTVANGSWKNDMLNGEATYYEPNISVSSSKSDSEVNFMYEGNFTDNYYDGEIHATWKSKSGTYEGTFYADMGKIALLKEEDGKYIYLDNGQGYYWYFTDSSALEGWKVWDGRYSK